MGYVADYEMNSTIMMCPDIIATHRKRPECVLIAMDESSDAFYAFEWYMGHLYKPGQHILIAYAPEYRKKIKTPFLLSDPLVAKRLIRRTEIIKKDIANRVKPKLNQAGAKGHILELRGDAGKAIVKTGELYDVTCIVTGSRDMGSFRRAFFGSVSQYVLHHAHCPVLICTEKSC